ncbi:MAG: hypothetical protein C0467_19540 [Planctomycetaceae bacterium]|nr:hypothetical protein [Planctomycetaceae bacterium]
MLFVAALTAALATATNAEDKKGTPVELAGLKSTAPGAWKEETPSNKMRMLQFKLPKAEGDAEDAELALFKSPGGGTVQANLERQEKKFEIPAGKKAEDVIKTEKLKFGDKHEGAYQDIQGTLLKKFPPFDPNAKITKVTDYRQIYVIFEAKEGDGTVVYSMTLLGPTKTVEKHKKAFDEWVKNFK